MHIAPNTVVTLNFTLTDDEGNILDQSQDNAFTYVHGHGRILPALEQGLLGKQAGDSVEIVLPPTAGFGERIPELTELAPKHLFRGAPVKAGMEFLARGKDGKSLPLRVVRVEGDEIHVDANHPLAGMTLFFSVDILDVRDATEAEQLAGKPATGHS